MKKTLLSLAVISGLFTQVGADEIGDLKAQVDALNKKVKKLEKKQKKTAKKLAEVKQHDAFDNIKFDLDFRTAYDNIEYETTQGNKPDNNGLYSMRLWLNMGYKPTDTMMFKGQLAVQKAFGQGTSSLDPNYNYFDRFDWVASENLTDGTLRLREAYWLWTPTALGRGWTLSVGRRPATNGFLVNLREDDQAKSPIGHIINMEFDGLSASMKTGDIVEGSYLKVCLGRGLSNATARFNSTGKDYVTSDDMLHNMDLVGVIAKLYDDGQYTAFAKYYKVFDAIGMSTSNTPTDPNDDKLASFGDADGAAVSLQISGIGNEINDFLDDTIVFASFAWTQTDPTNDVAMLGSTDKESGTSYYVGAQVPNFTGGRFGLEYNHGSKYWRPFTYAEDTMAGSKLAVRGDAYEAYWTQPIIEKNGKSIFSMQVRYTYMDYAYTGSQAFLGDYGTPYDIDSAQAKAMDAVKTAQDIRVYFRYRY
jgi:hypothetical protein